MGRDRERAEEATQKVLRQFYDAIGTPEPSPGIERLAFLALEASYESLAEQWDEGLQSALRGDRVLRAIRDATPNVGSTEAEEIAEAVLEALADPMEGGYA